MYKTTPVLQQTAATKSRFTHRTSVLFSRIPLFQLEKSRWLARCAISIENGSLVNARQGYVNFAFSSGLSNWHYLPSSQINVQMFSRGLAIKQLLQVAKLDYPVSGNLSVDVSMRGSQLNPMGSGSVRLAQGKVYGQPLQQFSVQFEGNGDAINSLLNVSTPAGSAKASLMFNPKSKGYEVHLDAPGVKLAQLQPVQERNLGVAGVLSATASGRGTLDNPQLTATVQIPLLQMRQASVSGIKADLNVANHRAQLALDSEVAQTFVQARGTMEVHASAEGPLNDKTRIQAQVIIP